MLCGIFIVIICYIDSALLCYSLIFHYKLKVEGNFCGTRGFWRALFVLYLVCIKAIHNTMSYSGMYSWGYNCYVRNFNKTPNCIQFAKNGSPSTCYCLEMLLIFRYIQEDERSRCPSRKQKILSKLCAIMTWIWTAYYCNIFLLLCLYINCNLI